MTEAQRYVKQIISLLVSFAFTVDIIVIELTLFERFRSLLMFHDNQ